ncbi:hypothetical protein CFB89_12085 [Burkholderia sp. AU16741]|nr:hypothetical protein CFB89_12085 [Burkholderia sp. AU16741]
MDDRQDVEALASPVIGVEHAVAQSDFTEAKGPEAPQVFPFFVVEPQPLLNVDHINVRLAIAMLQ